MMRQTVKARFHHGVLQPLEPLSLADETEVEITVDINSPPGVDNILERAARVYQGLTADEVAQIEVIALDRTRFFREPAA
jgi:predicted DNA-binding antitoxin AbrB/MazE fold protein